MRRSPSSAVRHGLIIRDDFESAPALPSVLCGGTADSYASRGGT